MSLSGSTAWKASSGKSPSEWSESIAYDLPTPIAPAVNTIHGRSSGRRSSASVSTPLSTASCSRCRAGAGRPVRVVERRARRAKLAVKLRRVEPLDDAYTSTVGQSHGNCALLNGGHECLRTAAA